MLLQTNSYIVPKEKRAEHSRIIRRFRQTLRRLGCDHFEVYEQVGSNWSNSESAGRYVQILRFVDRKHQLSVQSAERVDPSAQAVIADFCELINFPYQQQQGLFAVGFYTSVLPVMPKRGARGELISTVEHEVVDDPEGEIVDPENPAPDVDVMTEVAMDDATPVTAAAEEEPAIAGRIPRAVDSDRHEANSHESNGSVHPELMNEALSSKPTTTLHDKFMDFPASENPEAPKQEFIESEVVDPASDKELDSIEDRAHGFIEAETFPAESGSREDADDRAHGFLIDDSIDSNADKLSEGEDRSHGFIESDSSDHDKHGDHPGTEAKKTEEHAPW
jgi:hypothetical protein